MPASYSTPSTPLAERGYIGLSFSGGGYRATAFSLGTMALLQDLQLLSKARVMSSVSGGSLALGAFLCAKAGARLSQESEFDFYKRFWDPLMLALSSEVLADAFVRLPLLLQGEKIILHAADATQAFLNSLLGQEATLGSEAITQMLGKEALSPDYVFFNAANISSLSLFRFGIQRGAPPEGDSMAERDVAEPVYVLNRYFLKAKGQQAKGDPDKAAELYRHARDIHLGDCVAASFTFPGGFEPLIFPDDYFREDYYTAGREEAGQVCAHFRKSLICDRSNYLAFLDGGLYDNLGLSSVEDIRQFLIRRTVDLNLERKLESDSDKAAKIEREQPINYVIATDVDNIQPAVGSYKEPSLDKKLEAQAHVGNRTDELSRRRGRQRPWLPWVRVLRTLLSVAVMPLLALGLITGLILGVLLGGVLLNPRVIGTWLPRPLWLGTVITLIVLAFGRPWFPRALAGIGRWLRKRFGVLVEAKIPASRKTTWLQKLGLSTSFNRLGIDNDLQSFLLRAGLGVLSGPDRSKRFADLRVATLDRRAGQLLPAFNGYLKRTRSLTYGYLQQTYANGYKQHQESAELRCHLIRNMIFELIPGPDVDPDYAANLITLPVQDYRLQEEIVPQAPIMRKLMHANYVSNLLLNPCAFATDWLPMQLWHSHADLCSSVERLNLVKAAEIWTRLTKSLELGGEGPQPEPINPIDPTICNLVVRVRGLLQKAMDDAVCVDPDVDEQLRQRCHIKPEEDATSYSWIPLICEMATNLNTTLWVKGYRWYRPNKLENNRIETTGGWYVEMPTGRDDCPLLDLGVIDAPAAAITALAGYLSTCFNLLEFFYASLGSSKIASEKLVKLLTEENIEQWDRTRFQDLKDLPYTLRIATYKKIKNLSLSDKPKIQPGEVNLLEPWLTVREGFPDSWRETERN